MSCQAELIKARLILKLHLFLLRPAFDKLRLTTFQIDPILFFIDHFHPPPNALYNSTTAFNLSFLSEANSNSPCNTLL